MLCSARKRHTEVIRPSGMAERASMGMHEFAYSRRPVLPTSLDACRDTTALFPEKSTTLRRHRRLGGTTTPIPVVTANGRLWVRNEEGSCGNGLF
jgi:hypothetical protein